MPRYPLRVPRKQRTRAHVLADLSVNHVEKCALQCGFAVDRIVPDYGLDLAIFTFDQAGFLERGVLWLQIKATDRLKRTRDGTAALVRLDRRDVLAWLGEVNPVFLVLYDAKLDRGFWLSIHQCFAGSEGFAKLHGKTITIRVPTANLMNEQAIRQFAVEKAAMRVPREKP